MNVRLVLMILVFLVIKRLVWIFLLLLLLTSCVKEFRPTSKGSSDSPSIKVGSSFSEGKVVSNCLETSVNGLNACIFGKNVVADAGQSLPLKDLPVVNAGSVLNGLSKNLVGLMDVSDSQNYAVHIPGDELITGDFAVDYSLLTGNVPSYSRNSHGDWKYPFNEDLNFNLVNIHTFFWLNRLAKAIKDVTGSFYAENKKISVVPLVAFSDSSSSGLELLINAFWAGQRINLMAFGISKRLGPDTQGGSIHTPLGLDSGIVAHEAGHAILDYASPAEIRYNSHLEKECGYSGSATCSKEVVGSPHAIHEGVGDIMSIFLFPNSTAIGELFDNSINGLGHCGGLPRDVALIKARKLKAQALFNACARNNAPGEIHALGSVYSTIWYGVFQRALAQGGEEERKGAYRLFFETFKKHKQPTILFKLSDW